MILNQSLLTVMMNVGEGFLEGFSKVHCGLDKPAHGKDGLVPVENND